MSPVELTGGGLGGEGGAKSYDGEKARSSIKHSILSGWTNALLCVPRAYFGCALDLQGALAEVGVLNAQAQLSVPKYQQEFIYFTAPDKRSFRVCNNQKSECLSWIKKI